MTALKRIHKDLQELRRNPVPGCAATPVPPGTDMFHWEATIEGPPDTPYSGGLFRLSIEFPQDFPFSAPRIWMKTRIYHPNIQPTGLICLDTLTSHWSSALNIGQVLLSIQQLMADPFLDNPFWTEAAGVYMRDRQKFNKTAKQWTQKYAKPPVP
ncbi:unnamed protein product [Oppiella nova]|uniref:E2 ubiquitin-conjugating enzyme n=1 Tax=Oppiella nova TaxID=334625 RepID=A0A7R9MJ04_9ACAR|nr:unnamed protein product [Oppiella nova]CAG2178190.1 unnamed protein product [Oppiella nova]